MIGLILGTRPELIKIFPIVNFFKKKKVEYKIIHTGQHYSKSLNNIFLKDFKILNPDYNLKIGSKPQGEQTALMTIGIEKILSKGFIKTILVYGDTNSALAGALAGSKFHDVCVVHLEAGLRSFEIKMPEETNRKAIDHISDILIATTIIAKNFLIKEAIPKNKIFISGNTIVDAIKLHSLKIDNNINLLKNYNLNKKKYFLLTLHRQENVNDKNKFLKIYNSLEKISKNLKTDIIFPAHPRTQKLIKLLNLKFNNKIKIIEPVNYLNFLTLIKNSKLVITDSGGIQEESCTMRVPAITLRTSTERQETVHMGANILSKYDYNSLLKNITRLLNKTIKWQKPYGSGNASEKIYNILKKLKKL
jgi:UDP-N-acetylglucosamine 2-epimerase (non-hydrolysing)